jgi:hypothetical protein
VRVMRLVGRHIDEERDVDVVGRDSTRPRRLDGAPRCRSSTGRSPSHSKAPEIRPARPPLEAICRLRSGGAPDRTKRVVSLLSTQKALQDAFENGLKVLLDIVRAITSYEYRRYALLPRTPAALSSQLLDTLFEKAQVHWERGGGRVTADMLMRVVVVCAESAWGMVGRWLKVGRARLPSAYPSFPPPCLPPHPQHSPLHQPRQSFSYRL